MAEGQKECRKAFEEWAESEGGFSFPSDYGTYEYNLAERAFRAGQNSRAESGLVKDLQDRLAATERGERAADNEVERLQATVKEMEAALGPFAKAYDSWGGGNAREHFASSVVPAHFARAAEAVAKAKPPAAKAAEESV